MVSAEAFRSCHHSEEAAIAHAPAWLHAHKTLFTASYRWDLAHGRRLVIWCSMRKALSPESVPGEQLELLPAFVKCHFAAGPRLRPRLKSQPVPPSSLGPPHRVQVRSFAAMFFSIVSSRPLERAAGLLGFVHPIHIF